MTDQQILIDTIERAGTIIARYIEPDRVRDPKQTVNSLITVLETQEVAGAVQRLKAGFGFKVVKLWAIEARSSFPPTKKELTRVST